MWKTAAFVACVVLGAGAAHAQPTTDGSTDHDLAMVKRAVEKDDEAPAPQARAHRTAEPRWFRVRIEDRKGAKVKVNLPLAVVRGLSDEIRTDWTCGRRHRPCTLRLSEVLDQLESGEDLVEVKDEDATIRIWID
jgi:hypothetical protein